MSKVIIQSSGTRSKVLLTTSLKNLNVFDIIRIKGVRWIVVEICHVGDERFGKADDVLVLIVKLAKFATGIPILDYSPDHDPEERESGLF